MMNAFFQYTMIILLLSTVCCCTSREKSDAFGNFEATTITVGAKGTGQLDSFGIEEGDKLDSRVMVGLIDTTQLFLEKMQMVAQIGSLDQKLQEAAPEIAVLLEQKSNLIRERNRTQNLVARNAATQKQLDDYNGEIDLVDQRINSTKRQTTLANRGILAERLPLEAKIASLENKIADNKIINPIAGTVLTKFVESGELVTPGTPLYKIANLEFLKLRGYTSALLLQKIRLGDTIIIKIDDGEDDYRSLKGVITWISGEAEFTPKTIETREERVNLVYALDIEVKNDGSLKIGMPGEAVFPFKNPR